MQKQSLVLVLFPLIPACTSVDDHSYRHNDFPPSITYNINQVKERPPTIQQSDREFLQYKQTERSTTYGESSSYVEPTYSIQETVPIPSSYYPRVAPVYRPTYAPVYVQSPQYRPHPVNVGYCYPRPSYNRPVYTRPTFRANIYAQHRP